MVNDHGRCQGFFACGAQIYVVFPVDLWRGPMAKHPPTNVPSSLSTTTPSIQSFQQHLSRCAIPKHFTCHVTIFLLSCNLDEQCPRPSRTPRAALLPRTIENVLGACGSKQLFLKVLTSLSKAALYISNVITSASISEAYICSITS